MLRLNLSLGKLIRPRFLIRAPLVSDAESIYARFDACRSQAIRLHTGVQPDCLREVEPELSHSILIFPDGQPQLDDQTAVGRVRGCDAAAVQTHGAGGDGESQACASRLSVTRIFNSIEGAEDFIDRFFRHAR